MYMNSLDGVEENLILVGDGSNALTGDMTFTRESLHSS